MAAVSFSLAAAAWADTLVAQTPTPLATLAAGTLLRVQLDHTSKLSTGVSVSGHLLDPIWRIDREVIPAGTLVSGHVVSTSRVPPRDRVWPLLDGDMTPTRQPQIVFDTMTLPGGRMVTISAPASERAASLVHMQGAGHSRFPLLAMARQAVKDRIRQAHDSYLTPGRKDRFERFVFSQLPYHPQRIWRAAQLDAELAQPLQLDDVAASACADPPQDQLPAATLHARLLTAMSSKTATAGKTIDAQLTQPVYNDGASKLLLPEGAHLSGSVIRSKPARMFGRAGVLRFTLKQVSVDPAQSCAGLSRLRALPVNGQLTGVEAVTGSNLTLDTEGEAHAGPSPNQLLAPLVLTILLARTRGDDGNNANTGAVAGGGFGLAGRVVSLSTRNASVTAGFAYYALGKSLLRRYVLRGHEVEFPRNTRFDIEVSPRSEAARPLR